MCSTDRQRKHKKVVAEIAFERLILMEQFSSYNKHFCWDPDYVHTCFSCDIAWNEVDFCKSDNARTRGTSAINQQQYYEYQYHY